MFKSTIKEACVNPAKKSLKLENILINEMKFVDAEEGDITELVLAEVPEFAEICKFTLSWELPSEDEE